MEESPEEVLARLEQYVATLRGRERVSVSTAGVSSVGVMPAPVRVTPEPAMPEPVIPETVIPETVIPETVLTVDTLIPSRVAGAPEVVRGPPRLLHEVAPALLAVSSCAVVILAFVLFSSDVAIITAAVLGLVGVIGLVRRVSLAKAWIVGLVVAALLVRFS